MQKKLKVLIVISVVVIILVLYVLSVDWVKELTYESSAKPTFVPVSVPIEKMYSNNLIHSKYDSKDYYTSDGKEPMLTDSYVSRKITSDSQYYAQGYSTVMNGTQGYYHYTTVTLEDGLFGPVLASSGRVFGMGQVSATSTLTKKAGKPHVYYGW